MRYKVAPVSGFFLEANNVLGQPVYQTQIQDIFELSNARSLRGRSGGVISPVRLIPTPAPP